MSDTLIHCPIQRPLSSTPVTPVITHSLGNHMASSLVKPGDHGIRNASDLKNALHATDKCPMNTQYNLLYPVEQFYPPGVLIGVVQELGQLLGNSHLGLRLPTSHTPPVGGVLPTTGSTQRKADTHLILTYRNSLD